MPGGDELLALFGGLDERHIRREERVGAVRKLIANCQGQVLGHPGEQHGDLPREAVEVDGDTLKLPRPGESPRPERAPAQRLGPVPCRPAAQPSAPVRESPRSASCGWESSRVP